MYTIEAQLWQQLYNNARSLLFLVSPGFVTDVSEEIAFWLKCNT